MSSTHSFPSANSHRFDKEKELSSEENDIFTMLSDEHDEMLNYSKIYEAKEVLEILQKIIGKQFKVAL